ncbi:hypothetical protein E2C01_057916 [Portunus trituberculatus]|uniref:Uncharacterized protein n=1 Tax=Portunus trituberculatus TaxID=210409 RepID=A0A5B7H1N0_PORTR|nr:hypothetical protein [Portunus trituberculatus]
MNPSIMCSSPSYSASASAKEPFTAEYHDITWTTRSVILDGGTIKRFLGTEGRTALGSSSPGQSGQVCLFVHVWTCSLVSTVVFMVLTSTEVR